MKSGRNAIDTPFLLVLCALVVCGLLIFTSAALSLLAGARRFVYFGSGKSAFAGVGVRRRGTHRSCTH